jgi:hypothetical protein
MSTITEIETAISKLSPQDLAALRAWFSSFEENQKDREAKKTAWARVNEFRGRLAASGRVFSDSTDLIREDRER